MHLNKVYFGMREALSRLFTRRSPSEWGSAEYWAWVWGWTTYSMQCHARTLSRLQTHQTPKLHPLPRFLSCALGQRNSSIRAGKSSPWECIAFVIHHFSTTNVGCPRQRCYYLAKKDGGKKIENIYYTVHIACDLLTERPELIFPASFLTKSHSH